jgi:hypothetical protein
VSTLTQQAALAADPQFQARVQAAMVATASNIVLQTFASFGGDGPTYTLRESLATSILTSGAAPYLPRFAAAVAVNAVVVADIPASPVAITYSTAALPSVITTAAAHGLASGQIVEIAGHLVNTAVNGTWAVTVISTTTFSVPVAGSGIGGVSGTVTLQPPDADINTAVASVWNGIAGATVAT